MSANRNSKRASNETSGPSGPASKKAPPTVTDIIQDPITKIATEYWAPGAEGPHAGKYDGAIVKKLYETELRKGESTRLQLLELSGYLENYLWLHFDESVGFEHIFSIVLMINEKFRESIPVFEALTKDSEKFQKFFKSAVGVFSRFKSVDLLSAEGSSQCLDLVAYTQFLTNSFRSLEDPVVRRCTLRYLSLPIWSALSKARLNEELEKYPQIARHWQYLQAQAKKDAEAVATTTAAAAVATATAGDDDESPSKHANKKQKTGKKGAAAAAAKQEAAAAKPVAATAAAPTPTVTIDTSDCTWIPDLLTVFITVVEKVNPTDTNNSSNNNSSVSPVVVKYIERSAELIVDLLSQLPTRRFLNALIDDLHIVIRSRRSKIISHPQGKLFSQLIDMVEDLSHFEVHDQTGKELSADDVMTEQNGRIHKLQTLAFTKYKTVLRDMVFSSTGELGKTQNLRKHLDFLTLEQLKDLAVQLGKLTDHDLQYISHLEQEEAANGENVNTASSASTAALMAPTELLGTSPTRAYIMEVLLDSLAIRSSQLDALNRLSLYPNEELLWDGNQVPLGNTYNGEHPLALPKLNLQFLTVHDYLLRNFILFRLESAFEIREDVVDAIKRMGPRRGLQGNTVFGGWARMALPTISVSVDEVSKPKLGETIPAFVHCTVEIDISRFSGEVREEWESLREHDVVFLAAIEDPQTEAAAELGQFEREREDMARGRRPRKVRNQHKEEDLSFPHRYGVRYVRGGEVFELRDEEGIVLNDPVRPDERKNGRAGTKRRLRLKLDPAQYYADMRDGRDCYSRLNIVVRRKPKENNFKAVLETIRDLMNTPLVGRALPQWLREVFLGYGSVSAANYRSIKTIATNSGDGDGNSPSNNADEDTDYVDTFLDAQHLIESFPTSKVLFVTSDGTTTIDPTATAARNTQLQQQQQLPPPPYRLRIKRATTSTAEGGGGQETVWASHYNPLNPGPYPEDQPPQNSIRFTPVQVEAVRSGINSGLTLVVGPPGTGKTDVAVQIISNLYHNHPKQKILLVAHSNAALNDLFEKIMERNVDPRHLLRLGSGERDLRETLALAGAGGGGRGQGEAFSKQGRVEWTLTRRLQLLEQVQRLAVAIGVTGDVGYTCETAEYFKLQDVQSRIEKFFIDVSAVSEPQLKSSAVEKAFPFTGYFTDTPKPLFTGSYDVDLESAKGCFRHISKLFEELADYRAFELLRTQTHRSDYLLTKQARIVAMTCTHAAMTRRRLVELGFLYDSLVMEEAAQVLEVETLIPMLLQSVDSTLTVNGSPTSVTGESNATSRLKRVVLIGDHFQLPPVVKHLAFQKHAHLDQSMFTRFVRLGVPPVLLDRQGRARPEIAALYSWRYATLVKPAERDSNSGEVSQGSKTASATASALAAVGINGGLGNLPNVLTEPAYRTANPGFVHTFQLINVPDFKGRGEHSPTPFFYQNLGEAEYIVAVYQYMRLIGYPADKITILTTYNGQKHLIRDVIAQRCWSPIFGKPACITTVDKYQGQQNDYVLLSLVRTESVGHLRDVRRLVVVLSRARLGLYVFCRKNLFENCYELSPAFSQLLARPTKLELLGGEGFPTNRPIAADNGDDDKNKSFDRSMVLSVEGVTPMGVLVYQMVQQSQKLQAQQLPPPPSTEGDASELSLGTGTGSQVADDDDDDDDGPVDE